MSGGPTRRACDSAPSALLGQPPLTAPPKPGGHSEEPGQGAGWPVLPSSRLARGRAALSGAEGSCLGPLDSTGPSYSQASQGEGGWARGRSTAKEPPHGAWRSGLMGRSSVRLLRVAVGGVCQGGSAAPGEGHAPDSATEQPHLRSPLGNTSPQPALHELHSELNLLRSSLRLRGHRPPLHRKPC